MKLKIAILLIILFIINESHCSISTEQSDRLRFDQVIIYSVSTKIDKLNYNAIGSISGGTYIYIKILGID